ncbi:MAG: GTPase RsgA, partial [Mucinivorans sp.]
NPVVVGDAVVMDGDAIVSVEPRRNYIIRRASNLSCQSHIIAANIDGVYIITTLGAPPTSPEFIDRVLVTAECYGIPSTIVINKCDINFEDTLTSIYEQAGYKVLRVSALSGDGIDELRERIKGQTVLLTGNSGVGKSTLINAIDSS